VSERAERAERADRTDRTDRIDPVLDLSGRRVLVTGGTRGIGAACCRLFARAGAAVLAVYRSREDEARSLLAELEALSDLPHRRFRADLTREAEVERLFGFVSEAWGGLDCLVNNAGVWERNPLERFDRERYRLAMEVNVTAPFLCAIHALPLLRASDDGNIVNVTSTAGQRGEAGYSPYAAGKGAMISATKAWSSELAPAVRVNSVAPGWVETEMTAGAFAGGGRATIETTIPLGRVASPDDVAGPVVFLASALARHVTGEILNVNGGAVLVG
jgi:3-oxoacyl-[acyl-carrier protein] reductase